MNTPNNVFAAIDIGSNSFHLLIAKKKSTNHSIEIIKRFSDKVQLGAGITLHGKISDNAIERGILCLRYFQQLLSQYPVTATRIVATQAVREASNGQYFLERAKIMGCDIDLISGEEEANLIYAGVYQSLLLAPHQMLVVDIGGGSTELALGYAQKTYTRNSLAMGCISWKDRYFSPQTDNPRFHQSVCDAKALIKPITSAYSAKGFDRAYASSGTAKALSNVLRENFITDGEISYYGVKTLADQLLNKPTLLGELVGIKLHRLPLLLPGLAIMIAVMEELKIDCLYYSKQALREGLIYQLAST